MKVAVAVHGRFHAFELAGQLYARRLLARLDTTYPGFAAPARLPLRTLPWLELIRRMWPRLHLPGSPDLFIARAFARSLAGHLPQADILVGWSGALLEAIEPARAHGLKVVLERGSTHMSHQTEILRDAHARFGLEWRTTDPRLIARELAEYESVDLICTGCSHARQTFLDRGIAAAKIAVNPYGVDLSRFSPGDHPRKKRILFAGLVGLRKGIPWLLDAFRALPADWELHLVGPQEPGFAALLHRYDMSRIILRGPLSHNALAEEYRQAAIFCLPSIEEGFGMVILQAMASGCAVVASTATGGPDAGDHGRHLMLVPPADSPALADALNILAADESLRHRLGEAAHLRVADDFSWNDYGERAVTLYQMLTNPKSV
ncbi:glycosyltransferase family 4 protein [Magnetospirillum sulfuroxidans]|uniref:Glycosyltransferase family 4 protein n=1 Tax=Magnetospirillum sulfuroxidans TaxID=611300 RepID=A0ABS5IH93_9PROT|nr:glycosyltransferase family 4 protein [Magnetospirillum sulfuroxidans]MBR9973714.1 glycosyltransferase family 4 protein [Magnetospirillum sulfuroxidans]